MERLSAWHTTRNFLLGMSTWSQLAQAEGNDFYLMAGHCFVLFSSRSVPLDTNRKEAGLWMQLTLRKEGRAEKIAEYGARALIIQSLKPELPQLPLKELINHLVFQASFDRAF